MSSVAVVGVALDRHDAGVLVYSACRTGRHLWRSSWPRSRSPGR